ncbi:C6 zinc finger domain-containing protein [Beauveria bassiana ARSEF 2860]|uniref:C6 zinc finger domain-containing protein n=1 Tax=Beauveria bassiana (strain ARSEF 2860) TaxID=655819 RepID=J4VZT8_BEAB2|nr:C6 zinc finger domain-containing protein [Beauveria bassiana ARSEF 2860]EJP63795.1 C6 zinc finger domain-containing protein [Beauveria bassiana ARSEF 2860]
MSSVTRQSQSVNAAAPKATGGTSQRRLLPRACIPPAIGSANGAENALLHHVRTCVVEDIAASRPSDFWYGYALPLSHSTAAINHALCALGAAHRYFVSDPCNPGHAQSTTVFCTESMQRYNDAIAALNPLLSSENTAHFDVVLICCAIFITIENLNGRSAEAARHLRAGCNIAKRFRSRQTSATTALIGRDSIDNLLFTLQDMFYCFGQYLAMYIGVDAFADLDFNVPIISMGDPNVPFTSLKEAEMKFRNIDQTFNTRMWQAKAYSPQPVNIEEIFVDTTGSIESRAPAMNGDMRTAAKIAARSDLAVWRQRFQPLAQQKQNVRQIAALDLDYAVWHIIAKAIDYSEDFPSAECEKILSIAEEIISMDAARGHPRFTFDGNMIWALFYICFGTKDVAIHARCLELLRRANRREGVWDSCDVAAICETAIKALNSNTLTWRDIPHGILTLAEMLHIDLQGFSLQSMRDIEVEAAKRKC